MTLVGDAPTPGDVRKLKESWLTPEIIEQALIRRVDDATGRELVGRNGRGGEYAGLVFPYLLPGEERIREFRLRRDKPDLEYRDGKPKQKAKYLAPPGRANMAYFPPGTTLDAPADTSLPVVVTEGEKKTLALLRLATWKREQPRWLPIGIPGVWNWRGTTGKTTGPNGGRQDVKGVIPDFDRLSWDGRKAYICFDSDVLTNSSVGAARRMLADELRNRGAHVLLVAIQGREGAKVGVDDVLASDGPEHVLTLFDDATPSGEPDLTRQPFTDAGNAERLVAMHGNRLRYTPEWKAWATYDGRRWARDTTQEVKRLAIDTMRGTYRQCVDIGDADLREKLEKHARQSEQARALRDMVALAPAVSLGMTISAMDFDRQPLFLNCTNGTLDLGSGKLYPHRRFDLLLKLCPHVYDPSAQCPEFLRFLYQSMGDREGASAAQVEAAHVRVEFLRKATGISLTADVSEKVVFCLFGPTDAGKTTFLNAIRYGLGDDYSGQVLIESLMANARQSNSNSQADMVDLLGKRFVTTSEAEGEHRLSEGRLKYLTQGAYSKIKAARKYENPIEFPATHKLWLDANERPQIHSTDASIWNRLKPIPFEFSVPGDEKDFGLPARLQREAPGILTWAVSGCQRWLREGLGEIPDIQEARQSWRDECDPLSEFLTDECELEPGDTEVFVFVKDMRTRYESWCKDSGELRPLSRKRFGERLRALGCSDGRRPDEMSKRHRTWEGVELK